LKYLSKQGNLENPKLSKFVNRQELFFRSGCSAVQLLTIFKLQSRVLS